MNETDDTEDRAARRREQNRIAQQNHRKRKQDQQRLQSPSNRPLWQHDWPGDDEGGVALNEEVAKQPVQLGYLDVFENLIQPPDPTFDWQLQPTSSLQEEDQGNVSNNPQTRKHPTPDPRSKKRRRSSSLSSASRSTILPESSSSARPFTQRPAKISRLSRIPSPVSIIDRPSRGHTDMSAPRSRAGKHYPSPPSAVIHGQTCLHLAASRGSIALVKYLLGSGMNPDITDDHGFTALHHAVGGGHEETVNVLLRRGADVELVDNGGRTALHFAIVERQDEIAVLLIDGGADMHATVSPPVQRSSK